MKAPTLWRSNPSAETNEYTYDSAIYTYNSLTQNYDGVVDNDMSDGEKIPTTWGFVNKTPTTWASDTSELISYDSAVDTYDSPIQNYDGSIDTNRKTPTRWSNS